MKILVFCPLNPNPPRMWGRTLTSIFRQDWPHPLHRLFAEGDNPFREPYECITHNYNVARKIVLEQGYDALLTVESDMILPPDAISRLAATGADIAYGLYVFRHGKKQWCAYTEMTATYGRSISEDRAAAQAAWGKVIEVQGVGNGCTLIQRKALEEIEFRLMPGSPWMVAQDWLLALDARAKGFSQACDLGVVCGHISYKPWPQVIWPDPEGERLYRIESISEPQLTTQVQVNVGRDGGEIWGVRQDG